MSEPDAGQVLATLFRRQSGRMTAALVRMLGVRRLDQAEDIVQETLLAALQAWHTELPRDPEGWLFTVMRKPRPATRFAASASGLVSSTLVRHRKRRKPRPRRPPTRARISCG